MKKIFCVGAVVAMMAVATAQDTNNITLPVSDGYGLMITPEEFLEQGASVLNFVSDGKITLYNADLTLNTEFDCQWTETYLSSINYAREVVNVKRTSLTVSDQPIQTYDQSLTRDEMIASFIEEQGRYGALVTYYVDGDDVFFVNHDSFMETPMYYGDRTPLTGVLLRGHSIYRFVARYQAEYTDWVESGRNYGELEYKAVPVFKTGAPTAFVASQTLFDTDSEFEYVVPLYGHCETDGNPSQMNPDSADMPVTTKTEYTDENSCITGYRIMSSTGREKQTIRFSTDYYIDRYDQPSLYVLDLSGLRYVVTECRKAGEYNDSRYYDFYRMAGSAGLQKVNHEPMKMCISPTVLRPGQSMSVALPDTGRQYDVMVNSVSGQRMSMRRVTGTGDAVQVSAPAQTGMHVVTVSDGNALVGSEKIIVK